MSRPAKKVTRARLATEEESVEIPSGAVILEGDLTVPEHAVGLVIFAHGSGSSRRSPRNRAVAGGLQGKSLATLLMDLLTPEENEQSDLRFDLGLMAARLKAATAWAGAHPKTEGLPVGYFGASTGAAIALGAAAELGAAVQAVVSRGGRPDLVGATLARVGSPTLFIVGSRDELVLGLNRRAFEQIGSKDKDLAIIRGATHLFEEEGALDEVTSHAARWFLKHLAKRDL